MSMQSFIISLRVFGWLFWHDLIVLAKDAPNNIIDSLSWPAALILMNGYITPALGMPSNYGTFITVSMLIIMASFKAWGQSNDLAADLAGPQAISYELTLPLPYWMVLLKVILIDAIQASVFTLVVIGVGKIVLGSSLTFPHFSLLGFIMAYGLSCLFFATFALWTAIFSSSVIAHTRLEHRLVGPLFFLSGFTASWALMNSVSTILGTALLFTPWIYAYEGTRGAMLGYKDYLPLSICLGMLVLFTILFWAYGTYLFKKRMDCV